MVGVATLSPDWAGGFVEEMATEIHGSRPRWSFSLRPPIEPGATWTDTTEFLTVLGGIEVRWLESRAGSVSRWQVEAGDSVLAVNVDSEVSWRGSGNHLEEFTAFGTGTSNQVLRVLPDGRLLSFVTNEVLTGTLSTGESQVVDVARTDSVVTIR